MPDTERLRVDTRTAGMLGRLLVAELVRRSLESADLTHRLRRRQVSRRQRALKLGALAVGLAAAGLAAKRARHRAVAPVA